MSEPEIESPTPSQVMSVSQSSDGSSIGGYVVVDGCDESVPNTDGNVDGTPADIPAKSESLAQAGSMSQDEVRERVHVLTKENEELKGVLLQNNTLLEEYFQELASMQKCQKETKKTLRKGYDHAKEVVIKLRERNGTLKIELKNEQNKNLLLEEQLSKLKEVKLNGPSLLNDNAVEVIKRLETEKNTLEMSNIKLQERITCLKAMREAESNAVADECETLISLESLTLTSDIQTSPAVLQENFKKLETEKEILMVDLEKIKIEMEQKQQHNSQLEEERDTLLKKLAELEQRQTLQVGEIKPEITDTQAAAAASKQIKELCEQLQVQTEALSNLKEELDAVRQESEMYKKKAEEFEKGKEPANNEDIETMKQQLQKYQEKEGVNEQAAAAVEAQLTKKMAELKQQLETEREAIGKLKGDVDNLTQERDVYKKKVEELEMHPEEKKGPAYNEEIETIKQQLQKYQEKELVDQQAAAALKAELKQQLETEREAIGKLRRDVNNLTQERDVYKKKVEELEMHPEEKKGNGDESVGEVHLEDTEQKGTLFEKLKKQIWTYQQREGDILNRENAVLEKEEELKQLIDEKKKVELQLADVLKEKKTLSQEIREQDKEAQSLKRQLSNVSEELNETREREVNQLKEELQHTNTAMTTALSNAEQLKDNMIQLMEQNENLAAECEKLKAECAQKEEGVQSLNELNEAREIEVNKLKEELTTRDEALATAKATLEPLKVQVTQLIQENQSLIVERERIMDDYTQQENMYQEHLHKITEDSEKQRNKRDEIIKTLRNKVSTAESQLQNALVQLEADSLVNKQLREEHERVLMEYEECLQAYRTTMDANKRRESEEHMTKTGLEDHIRRLTDQIRDAEALIEDLKGHLKDGDNLHAKLKEDARLSAEEMSNVREEAYDKERILRTQLEVFQNDFHVEREAREKQHEEILRLREQVRRYADEIDQLSNRGMVEMQRRHASFVQEPRDIQPQQQPEQPGGWLGTWFTRGPMDPPGVPNPGGEMGVPGQAQMGGGNQREQQVPRQDEEDWQCPTCRRLFPNFDTLQIHAVECNGDHAPRPAEHVPNQCPSCMEILPDMDTLQIHIEDCLERNQ